jgi:hypothetical protein
MAKQGIRWQVTLLVVAGLLVCPSSAFGQRHGGGSVRSPSGGGERSQRSGSGGGQSERGGAGGEEHRQQPHEGNQSMSAHHTGNVSGGGQHSSQQDAAAAEHHSNSDPYGQHSSFPGNQSHSPAAGAAAVAHNPNMGTTRPPYDGQRPPGTASAQTTAANHSGNTYGGVTVNNNNSVNARAAASRTNVGSVQAPYGTRTPYGTPYASSLPAGHTTFPVAGTPYHYSGGNFYQPVYSGGSVAYAPTPPAQMNFNAAPQQPVAIQQTPDEAASAALNVAQTLLKEQNNPNARSVGLETLANTARNYPGTEGAGQARMLLGRLQGNN